VNLRFIATAAPVVTVDEAKTFVARIKHEFADATHNISAYVVGHSATVVAHCTDDGEPSGPAGRRWPCSAAAGWATWRSS
jgi:putative IMPACT (imprinted ancient) family translation regulator